MFGKTKRYELNKIYHTAKGMVKFLKYIETEENDPKVQYINLTTNEIITDYYGTMYYKIIKHHKKVGLPIPEAVKYEYYVDLKRDLKFGVEMELISPIYNLERELVNAGIPVCTPDTTHQVVSGWKLVRDGSINAPRGYYGYELVSPPSYSFSQLETVCKVLKENGVKTNKSCGLHVHHDINELKRLQIKRIYEFYSKYEKLIDFMHAESRDSNPYCKSIKYIIDKVRDAETKEQLLVNVAGKGSSRYYDNSRYYKINLRSYLYYGTIEFRHAGGTVDFNEIKSWVLFTHKIIERALQINNDIQPMNEENKEKYIENPVSQFENMMKEIDIYWLTDAYKNLLKRAEKRARRIA